jgi:hypothetical protein
MLSLETFVISDSDDEDDIDDALNEGKGLDPLDFSVDGYPVDEKIYPMVAKAIAKGKSRAHADEDEEVEEEDIPTREDTPTSSAFDVSTEESQADATPLDPESQMGSRPGDDSPILNRRLDFVDVQEHEVADRRPSSTQDLRNTSGRGRGLGKKKRGGMSERSSPLGRFIGDSDKLDQLNRKVEEGEAERKRMQADFEEREARLLAQQAKRDEEARIRHEKMMKMIHLAFSNKLPMNMSASDLPTSSVPLGGTSSAPEVQGPSGSVPPDVQSGDGGAGVSNSQQRSPPSSSTEVCEPSRSPAPQVPPHPQSEEDVHWTSVGPSRT